MRNKRKWLGSVADGKLILDKNKNLDIYLSSLEGKKVSVAIGKKESRRSILENRYYFGVVVKMIGDYIGEENPIETHSLIVAENLSSCEDKVINGKVYFYRKDISTSALTISEFEDYLSKVRMWASKEFSLYIPMPNEILIK